MESVNIQELETKIDAGEMSAATTATITTTTVEQSTNTTNHLPTATAVQDKSEVLEMQGAISVAMEEPLKAHILESPDKLNVDIPIISLSDGEDVAHANTPVTKVIKKRKSMDVLGSVGAKGEEGYEERYRLKRRKIKVAGAPKMPLTGYVRYMNDRRESLRKEYPLKTAIEHTKMIGEEWQTLPEERKAPYMEAAELDKQRYLSELHAFLKARPDVLACELAKNKRRPNQEGIKEKTVLKEKPQLNGSATAKPITKELPIKEEKVRRSLEPELLAPTAILAPIEKPKRKRTPTPPPTGSSSTTSTSNNSNNHTFAAPIPGEIPIFTNEFLEHNKVFDMELRTLRKSKADLEQQNAVLEKHVENMKFGVEKMTTENDELQEKNRLLEIYLDKLKRKLAQALAGLAIPTEPNGATLDNIDKYMGDLYKMATTNTHGPASLNKAKDIIRKLDLQIHL